MQHFIRKNYGLFVVLCGLSCVAVTESCRKTADPTLLNPSPVQDSTQHPQDTTQAPQDTTKNPQDSTFVPIAYHYNGQLTRFLRFRDTDNVIKEFQDTILASASLLVEADSITATVDSMTQVLYKIKGNTPGSYVIYPCCRPNRTVIITANYDSLKVFYSVTDGGGGPYLFNEKFVGKK